MGNTTGTIRKAVIDGITFDVFADANITFNRTAYEIEGQATTGKNMMKMTKRVQTIESLDLAVTPKEMETLKSKSESLADVTLSVELADASVYKATGRVYFESYESETGKATCTLIPVRDWQPFLAD